MRDPTCYSKDGQRVPGTTPWVIECITCGWRAPGPVDVRHLPIHPPGGLVMAGRARCDECGLTYDVGRFDVPITEVSYTCDDCGGYVDLMSDDDVVPHDETLVNLGGGMVVPLAELLEDDEETGR